MKMIIHTEKHMCARAHTHARTHTDRHKGLLIKNEMD